MNRTHALVAVALVGLLAVGAGALYTGFGPAPGGGSEEPITDFPTATPSGSDGGSSSPPFTFTVDDIEECGSTCREVTATLKNEQDRTATGVTVYSRIYAGQDTTAEEDLIWQGKEEVGTLAANESSTHTERVELSFQEGLAVQGNDGWVTIVTSVRTDDRTVTFTSSEQVA